MTRTTSRLSRVAGWLLIGATTTGVVAGCYGFAIEPNFRLTVTELKLPPSHGERLARALGDARIVHLSDLHIRGFGWREHRLVERLQSLRPDLILMTGDYGEGVDGCAAMTRVLGSVKPRLGTFGVLGNNDHNHGQRDAIVAALEAAGVTLLGNRSVTIAARNGPVTIAGVDDPHYGWDDIAAAMRDAPADTPLVLLAHSPDLLRRKSRGLMINGGDERRTWDRGLFWQDGTHVRPDPGEVSFPTTGTRRLRVAWREDGVAFQELRLVPEASPGRRGREHMADPRHEQGEIVIRAADVKDEDMHGGDWMRRTTEKGIELAALPDRGMNRSSVDVEPDSYFEASFDAVAGVRYHVWAHLDSANDRGTSDSLFLQFTDSLNERGEPDYRIGVAMPEVDTNRVDLMLAGHEHGGQVRLPFIGPLEPNVRRSPYQMGLYRVGSMPLFLSRGVGWSSLPVRFWCPPEIVVIDSTVGDGRSDAGTL